MKRSHYDVLQVSPKATAAVIDAAYQHLRAEIQQSIDRGNAEARGDLLILDESYKVLADPQLRAAYDQSLADAAAPARSAQRRPVRVEPDDPFPADESLLMTWWNNRRTSVVFMFICVCAAVFAVYKFTGQGGDQKIRQTDVEGKVGTNQYRAETERKLVEGALDNQDKLIDRAHDVATRQIESRERMQERQQSDRRDAQERAIQAEAARREEADARRQAYEAQREKQERERQARMDEAANKRQAAERLASQKRELCNIYRSEGRRAEATAAGC